MQEASFGSSARLAAGAALALVLAGAAAEAAAQSAAPSAEELARQLRQRDQAIAVLRRRLDALEKRLAETEKLAKGAVQMGEPAAVEPAPPPARPPAAAPTAEPPAATAQRPTAPGRFEVDPLAAERALERVLVRTGALLLGPGQAELEPSLTYQRNESSGPVLFFGGGGAIVGVGDRKVRRDLWQPELGLRFGLPFDSQFELALPYNYVDQSVVDEQGQVPVGGSYASGGGLGDLNLAFAKTLLREDGWIPDLIGRLSWDTATGETSDGGVALPAGFHEVQAQLVAIKRNDPLVFLVSGSYQYAFENDDVKPGQQLGFTFGSVLATSPSTSLRASFETVFGTRAEINGQELKGSDFTAASLNLGASIVLAPRVLFDIVGTIGLTDEAADYAVKVSLPIRFDTPFF